MENESGNQGSNNSVSLLPTWKHQSKIFLIILREIKASIVQTWAKMIRICVCVCVCVCMCVCVSVQEFCLMKVFLCTSEMAEVCYWFGPVRPFATQSLRIGSLAFFLFFCIKLDSHNVRKVTKPNFCKKSHRVSRAWKVHKIHFNLNIKVLIVF